MNYAETTAKLMDLDPRNIKNPPWDNPRGQIAQKDYEERRESISKQGIHTPLMVRQTETGFEIVAGWTRRDIAIELLMPVVPCLVRVMSDEEAYALAVSENIDRTQVSILEEAKSFRKIVGNHNGDVQAASSEMGWSKDKLNRALQLLRSSEKVQSLIGVKNDNGFVLSVAHAGRLSILPENIQDIIVDAVIRDKMNVNLLKEKIERSAKRDLSTATFCIKDCAACQYNTQIQTSLFESDNTANCTNPPCFQKKTDEHYEERLKELEQDYGKVVLLSTVENPLTISSEMVGKDQFNDGCLSCDKHCAVLCDKGVKQGNILKDQCLDSACADTHKKAEAKRIADANKPENTVASGQSATTNNKTSISKPVKKGKSDAKPQAQATLPKRLIMESQTSLRTTAKNALVQHPSYYLAVSYAALKVQNSTDRFEDVVIKAMSLSPEELQKAMMDEIEQLTNFTQKDTLNVERLLIRAAKTHISDFEAQAIADWTPTSERLTDMTNAIRQQALEQSGFADAYKTAHDEKEYQKLLNLKTADQVKAILAFTFDWSEYAPEYYVNATKTQKYNF